MTIRTHKKGFTLIETLVAISILVVATMGPITIAAQGLRSAFFAKEQLTAVYLAQEAIEYIRLARDRYALEYQGANDGEWVDTLDASCQGVEGCGVDVREDTFVDCALEGACQLSYDADAIAGNDAGMYTYATGEDAPFTRRVRIEGTSNETVVTVVVSWQSGLIGGEKTVTLQSYLFNQYDDF